LRRLFVASPLAIQYTLQLKCTEGQTQFSTTKGTEITKGIAGGKGREKRGNFAAAGLTGAFCALRLFRIFRAFRGSNLLLLACLIPARRG